MPKVRYTPPEHLSAPMQKWFKRVVRDYDLDQQHILILISACEMHDRAEEARLKVVADGGVFSIDRWGQLKPHPLVKLEKECRLAFAKLIRELCLDANDPKVPELPRAH